MHILKIRAAEVVLEGDVHRREGTSAQSVPRDFPRGEADLGRFGARFNARARHTEDQKGERQQGEHLASAET